MKVYVVPYISQKNGTTNTIGYHMYVDLKECITKTRENSFKGSYSFGDNVGYMGPVKPLGYYETNDSYIDKHKIYYELKSDNQDIWFYNFNPLVRSEFIYLD